MLQINICRLFLPSALWSTLEMHMILVIEEWPNYIVNKIFLFNKALVCRRKMQLENNKKCAGVLRKEVRFFKISIIISAMVDT